MNKTTMTLTAAALLACASTAASAGTFTQTVTFSAVDPWTHTFNFLGYDTLVSNGSIPAGNTLTDVHDSLLVTANGTLTIMNISTNTTGTWTAALQDIATKTLPAPIGKVTATNTTPGVTISLAPLASTTRKFTGTATGGSTTYTSPPNDLTGFLSDFTAVATNAGNISLIGPTNVKSTFVGTSTVTDKLEFSFTPTQHAPEPATLSLLGVGLAGLGLARRRKGKGANRA